MTAEVDCPSSLGEELILPSFVVASVEVEADDINLVGSLVEVAVGSWVF
jgi:hypothetical protein